MPARIVYFLFSAYVSSRTPVCNDEKVYIDGGVKISQCGDAKEADLPADSGNSECGGSSNWSRTSDTRGLVITASTRTTSIMSCACGGWLITLTFHT